MAAPPGTTDRLRDEVAARIEQARNRFVALECWTGLAAVLAVACALATLLLVAESVLYLSPVAKVAGLSLLAIGFLAGIVRYALLPVLRPVTLEAVAARIESAHGGLHQHLTNVLQLWDRRGGPGQSTDLIDAAVAQAAEATRQIDFGTAIDAAPAKAAARRLGLVLVLSLLGLQLTPGAAADAFARLSHPTERYVRPRETRIAVAPGDTTLIVGDSLALRATVSGVVPLEAALRIREDDGDDPTTVTVPVRAGSAVHPIPSVRRSFTYRWDVHDADAVWHAVHAKPRPVVLTAAARYRYPAYTGLPDRTDTEGGDIAALTGTRVDLAIRASRPLAEAWLAFATGGRIPAEVAGDSARVGFILESNDRFTIGLRDTAGVTNANPVAYRVLTLQDDPPSVALLRPGTEYELGETMRVPLLIEAVDDFGVARLEIAYRINPDGEPAVTPLEIDTPGGREITQTAVWDLSDADLLPGDQIAYRIRAYDINTVTGPGVGQTDEHLIRFPSLHEIHEAARQAQDRTVRELEEMADESRRLQRKMESVSREIVKNEEATWEDRAEIRDVVAQQEKLREQMERNARALEQTRQRLEQSGMLSEETREKIEQVRTLMESLDSPELERLSRELRDAAEEADPEMIQEAIERLSSEQEAFQENLDRTIALLKRVRDEQMLDALTTRLRELADEQEDIRRRVSSTPRPEELNDRQAAVSREAEQLEASLDRAAESVDAPDDRLRALADAFEDRDIPDRSAQTRRDLDAGRRDRARKGADDLARDLDQLASEMQRIRDTYRQIRKDELLDRLTSIFRDALDLSRSQEGTATRSQEGRADLDALAERQTRDLNAASRLAERIQEASRQTFLVPPRAGNSIRNAMKKMQGATGNMQRGLGDRAAADALEAMAGLNGTAAAVREAAGAVRSAGSATGMGEMLQKLAEASDRQGELNAQTQGAMGQPTPGGDTPGGAGLARLSAEQRAIQQMLDQLRREHGGEEGQALGDLSRISEDMADIARRLREKLDAPLVERQRRILSRLLDAQRSLRQRGFSNDREAREGGSFAYRGPGSLPADLGETANPLRDRLREALRQAYPDEYQSLIRRYFDRLIEDASTGAAAP